MYAFGALAISGGLALVSAVWKPPQEAYRDALSLLKDRSVLSIHFEGVIEGSPIKGDLVQDDSGVNFLRISYPLLKFINNQWIDISQAGNKEYPLRNKGLLQAVQFTKRLPSVKSDGARFSRYAFIVNDDSLLKEIPVLSYAQGEIWVGQKDGLPIRLEFSIPDARSDLSKIAAFISYEDHFPKGPPTYVRFLPEVLTEFAQFRSGKKVVPTRLQPLSAGGSISAFTEDFDHDRLSDALEVFYRTDPGNSDTDNDTYLDGEEVEQNLNPVGDGVLSQ